MPNIIELIEELKSLGVKLSLKDNQLVLNAPKGVISKELKESLSQNKQGIIDYLSKPIQKENQKYPLSSSQQRMWFLYKMDTDSSVYNIYGAFKLKGKINIDAFNKSINQVIKKHHILRTTFHFENNELYQKVHNELNLEINVIDSNNQDYKDIIQKEINYKFKLDTLSLIKISLVKISEEEHIMVVVFHHIIGDAWSCGLFIKEVSEYYQDFCNKKEISEIELPIQYYDFAIKQKSSFEQKEYKEQLNSIVNKLKDYNLFLPLPYDFKRPSKQTFNGKTTNIKFPNELTIELKKLSSSLYTTLFVVLVGSFKVLISKYSNENKILTGLPISGRTSRELENLIGVFVNTIVLRGELSNDLTFNEFVKQLSNNLLDSFDAQEIPFDKVVERLPINRTANYSPVFQTMFVMQNIPISFPKLDGLEIEIFEVDNNTSKFDLTLSFKEMNNEISLEYNTDLFLPNTINQFLENYISLLQSILLNPNETIGNLNILTNKQKEELLNTFPRRSFSDSENTTIHGMVEKSSLLFPDSIALKFNDETISYRILNEKSNQLARYFVDQGIKKGDKVAVSFDISFEMIITLLAILKVGACYIPLDPVLPEERIKFIIQDCNPDLIVIQKSEYIKTSEKNILTYDEFTYKDYSKENLNLDISKNDNAYIIYTSGSTGVPNGVLINHHNVIRLFETTEEFFKFRQEDIWVLFHSYAFDYSIWEIWSCLRQGSTLLLISKEMRRNPSEFYKLICKEKVTILNQTPSAFYHFSRYAVKSDLENSLRYLVLSGEALDINLLEDWYKKFDENKPILVNSYGITETTVFVTYREIIKSDLKSNSFSPIGVALSDLSMYVLDQNKNLVPRGVIGELYVGGEGLAVCYFNRDELNQRKFIKNPFGEGNLYKTGDHVRILSNNELEYIGRIDGQVKIRGHRIEIGEIESALNKHSEIKESAVKVFDNTNKGKYLVAYIVTNNHQKIEKASLKSYLKDLIPEIMIPNDYVFMESFPLTNNGKIDKKSLKEPVETIEKKEIEIIPPRNEVEKILTNIVSELLEINQVSIDTNFFDMGFHSLLIAKAHEKIEEKLKINFNMVELFNYPTIRDLSKFLSNEDTNTLNVESVKNKNYDDIAIIGLTGKFPQSENIDEYWNNILNKKECIKFYSDEELLENGVSQELLDNPKYVKANGIISNYKNFDASFFGFSPKEAEITDPQHRLFLEESYHALEDAGYTDNHNEIIGLFSGTSISRYLLFNISSNPDLVEEIGHFRLLLSNDKDYLSTLTAYKLNLKGPSITLQTACSTSLVAIHQACKSIQNGDCTMALAGGVSIDTNDTGYLYQEGLIASPDGHCRPFDKDGGGIVGGSGAGVVVLKSLKRALEDKDRIYGVIKGSAINNDGSNKAGFMAPSVQGQAQVIVDAIKESNVSSDSISYIETHGTATNIGDPIEIKALNTAFKTLNPEIKNSSCAIGSVKANIGHLDSSAGVAGFIKTALSVYNKVIPPSINFNEPNPKIDFENSPFYVNTNVQNYNKLSPYRASVSSFGVGGTNAHVIIEELKNNYINYPIKKSYLLRISAKSENSLYQYLETFKNELENKEYNLNDLIYSLDKKKNYQFKYSIVIDSLNDLKEKLNNLIEDNFSFDTSNHEIVFSFSGLGTQYLKMGQELYENESVFKEYFDKCISILKEITNKDFKEIIFNGTQEELKQPSIMQPSIFCFQYSLAQLWISKGIKPQYIIGHSFGEYASACISEVISLKDALNIVVNRGLLFDKVSGEMLSVQSSKDILESLLNSETEISVNNGDNLFTVSGSQLGIQNLIEKLKEKEIKFSKLDIPHATHSYLTESILDDFAKVFENITFNKPVYNFLSNLTGDFIEEFSKDYFVKHLRNRVLFFEQLNKLKDKNLIFIEVGADTTMNNLINRLFKNTSNNILSLKSRTKKEEYKTFLNSLSSLWKIGFDIEHKIEGKFISTPLYQFDRKKYWIEKSVQKNNISSSRKEFKDWFYIPSWKKTYTHSESLNNKNRVIFLSDINDELVSNLLDSSSYVINKSSEFKIKEKEIFIREDNYQDYVDALDYLKSKNFVPTEFIYLDCHGQSPCNDSMDKSNNRIKDKVELWNKILKQEQCHYEQLCCVVISKTFAKVNLPKDLKFSNVFFNEEINPLRNEKLKLKNYFFNFFNLIKGITSNKFFDKSITIKIITNELHKITGFENIDPYKSLVLGFCKSINQEFKNINCINIDFDSFTNVQNIIREINSNRNENIIAYRKNIPWIQTFEKYELESDFNKLEIEESTYLITGGTKGIALEIAKNLKGKIILASRNISIDNIDTKKYIVEKLDVTNIEDVENIFAKYPDIKHIIHSAGISSSGIYHNKTMESLNSVLEVKVKGTENLYQVAKKYNVKTITLFSSLASYTGGIGQLEYSSANNFLDYFAENYSSDDLKISSINWCAWKESGMANKMFQEYLDKIPALAKEFNKTSISNKEGFDVFNFIFNSDYNRFLVSPTDINYEVEKYNKYNLEKLKSEIITPREVKRFSSKIIVPNSSTEKILADIWKKHLGLNEVGITQNFFDLGGHSLLLAEMKNDLDKSLNREVPISTLLKGYTIKEIAQEIDKEKVSSPIVISLRSGDKYPPFFCIHAVSGTIFPFYQMASNFKEGHTFYGIQSASLVSSIKNQSTIEEMASFYISEIKKYQSSEPYFIGGWSFGGLVAFEVARQLVKENKKVQKLVIIDMQPPSKGQRHFIDEEELTNRFVNDMKGIFGQDITLDDDRVKDFYNVFKNNINCASNYLPEYYDGEIILIKASQSEYKSSWSDYCSNLIEYTVDGDHYSIIKDKKLFEILNNDIF